MSARKITYPQYRKYSNDRSYFKIISSERFEEIQVIGDRMTLHFFEAKILPDRNYIHDMIHNNGNHWLVIDEKEYDKMKSLVTYS